MKHVILTILMIYFGLCKIFSQAAVFEFHWPSEMNELIFDIAEDNEGFLYIVASCTKPNQALFRASGLVVKLDNTGQFYDSLKYSIKDRRVLLTDILNDGSDQFTLCGVSTDTFPTSTYGYADCAIEMMKINKNLDILTNKLHPIPTDYNYYRSVGYKGLNDNYLVGGSFISDNIRRMFLYVFNNDLDSIMFKIYTDKFRSCYSINQLSDTSYWICDGEKSSYYMLDEKLNITDYDYARPYWNYTPGIKWESDTSFYLAGQWNGGPGDDIGLYKQFDPIDSTGNIFQSWGTIDTIDIPALINTSLDFNNKDSIFIGGTTNFSFYFMPVPSWYFVIQTDSNLNVRWERFYGGDARYTMSCIKASNDGGCIIAGNKYDYVNDTVEQLDIHILKLNSEGLLVSTPEQPTIEMHEALVFPNPGTDHIKVRIALQYHHSTFEMFDMHGRMVLSEQINGNWGEIKTSHLSPGTYVYRVISQDGLFESGKWIKQ